MPFNCGGSEKVINKKLSSQKFSIHQGGRNESITLYIPALYNPIFEIGHRLVKIDFHIVI